MPSSQLGMLSPCTKNRFAKPHNIGMVSGSPIHLIFGISRMYDRLPTHHRPVTNVSRTNHDPSSAISEEYDAHLCAPVVTRTEVESAQLTEYAQRITTRASLTDVNSEQSASL